MAGSRGGHFCCAVGAAGFPPPSPPHFRVLPRVWARRRRGDGCGLVAPIPFQSRRRERNRNHIGACREDTRCLSPSRRSSAPPCPLPGRCAPCRAPLYLLTRSPGGSPFGSRWICCCQFPEVARRARVSLRRTDQTRYSAAVWGKSEGEEEGCFCRVP